MILAVGIGTLALAVNRKYRHADVTGDDLLAELTSWGLRRAAAVIGDTLDGSFPALREQILVFIVNLRDSPA